MTGPHNRTIDLGIPGISDAVEIGAGGFGVVYRAVEADLGRTVAVKVLSTNLDEASRFRFDRERRAMGTLSGHPNIVTVYRGGHTPAGSPYLIMEYLERGSLADQLSSDGPLPWSEVLRFGIQLSGALETSHQAGVLHRDIKPGNILRSELDNAKLCDFGIARLHGAPETQSSVITASIAHAPPEIINGQRPDALADVYSLASTMYELISGAPAFVRPTDESMVPILARIHSDPIPDLPEGQLPSPMRSALDAAMAKDPSDRPPSALALGQVLVEAQAELGQTRTPLPFASSSPGTVASSPSGEIPPAAIPPFPSSGSGPLPPPVARSGDPDPRSTHATSEEAEPAAPITPEPHDLAGPTQVSRQVGDPPSAPAGASWQPPTAQGAGAETPGPNWRRIGPLAATSVAAVVVIGLMVWLIASGSDDDGTVTSTSDTAGTSDDPTSNEDQVELGTTIRSEVDGDYPIYMSITDTSGRIKLNVPAEWSDIQPGPDEDNRPFLGAAPVFWSTDEVDGMVGSYDVPGVTVSILGDQDGTTGKALDELAADESLCSPTRRDPVTTPIKGEVEVLTCTGTETKLIHYVFIPDFTNLMALMRIQVVSPQDVFAAETISQSLTIDSTTTTTS